MIDYSKNFLFDDPGEERAMRAEIAGHCEFSSFELLTSGGDIVKEPVWFKYDSGGEAKDIIFTQSVLIYLVSDRVISILKDNGITGWSTFPVYLFDEQLNPMEGYVGLSATGKAGAIDPDRSVAEHSSLENVLTEKIISKKIGVYFQNDEWDGADIFTPQGAGMILVSEAVVNLFEKNCVSNVRFIPCDKVERFEWSEFVNE